MLFEQVIRENLDVGRPDKVGLIFDRRIVRRGPSATPRRFRTRVLTGGVTPSLHVDHKHSKIKQYFKEGRALRTETTVNDTGDFGIGRRLCNLPALREVGTTANRRLLHVERLASDPITGTTAFTALNIPAVIEGQRVPAALRRAPHPGPARRHRRVHLLPHGFRARDLRAHLAPLLGLPPDLMTQGTVSYDLRRLRLHGLIERIEGTHRYTVTDHGLRAAICLTRVHNRLFRESLSDLLHPHATPTPMRRHLDRFTDAVDQNIREHRLIA